MTYLEARKEYTTTVTETVVVKDSPEAKILAGRDMTLHVGTVTNESSQVLSKGAFELFGGKFNNIAVGANKVTTIDGNNVYVINYYRAYSESPHSGASHPGVDKTVTEKIPFQTITTEELPGTTALYGGGKTVTIQANSVNNKTLNPVSSPIGSMATKPDPGKFTIPNSRLYSMHTEPTSQYLVETDPHFADYKIFISSDYMLENLGLKPEEIQKRLGDGFYEQKLVQEQIANLTGRTNLTAAESKEEEYKTLMNNGVTYGKEYNLQIGISLTAEQMANLTTDIVWMVEQEVEGQKVLAPVVYLSKVRQEELTPTGALITAGQVNINTTGDITNSGVIKGEVSTDLSAGNIGNRGGQIVGETLFLDAKQDILNQSGTITGGQVTLKAGKDIVNETLTSPMSGDGGYTSSTTHHVATISAGKDLTVDAKRDITISGANISAEQKVDLHAARDVEITSVEQQQHMQVSGIQASYNKTTNLTSGVQAGTEVSIRSDNDIHLQGAQIVGKKGVILNAANNLTIESVTDQEQGSIQTANGRSNTLSYSKTQNVLSSIQAGGDVKLISGKDTTIRGAAIETDQNVDIQASENLTVSSVQNQSDIQSSLKGQLMDRTELLDAIGLDSSEQAQIKTKVDAKGGGFGFGKADYTNSTTEQVASTMQAGKSVTLKSNQDTSLADAGVVGQDIKVTAGGDISLTAATDKADAYSFRGTSKNYRKTQTSDETVRGTVLSADNDIILQAGTKASGIKDNVEPGKGSITITGSAVTSDRGTIKLDADKDVVINEASERHESLVETKKTKSGVLSTKTTVKRDYALLNEAVGSTISGKAVDVDAGTDITVKASNVVGTNDVDLKAKHDLNVESAAETGAAEHYKYTKKSGLFSGGGLGLTLGKQSEKLTVNEKTVDQVGSTVGSINGNVNLTADNQVQSAGATLVAGKDINITGKDVTIDNTVDTYDSQTKYEFKQSGITVSLSGGVVNAATNAVNHIQRSGEVSDERLKALYDYKAAKDMKEIGKDLKTGINKKNLKKDVSVNISIGSSKTTSEQTVHTETVNPSNITAGQNVTITATTADITLQGTKVEAKAVKLDAAGDINLTAAQNTEQTTSKSKSSSWSAGVTLHGGVFGNASKGNSNGNGTVATHTGTVINASDKVELIADKDTNIIGSQVKGDRVTTDSKGDLNIASQQDIDNYAEKSSSSGIGISTGPSGGVTGSASKGKINSEYTSVTEQAGIYAGKDGFDITVGKNTDLKGAVISSEATPDKNKLSTDTLTYSDMENHADYSASSVGVNLDTRKNAKYNEYGITPDIGMPVSGDDSSTTKSAISSGTIIVGGKVVEPEGLSRDTTNSLNALGKIFDKQTVQEQQELASLFGELAYEQVHKISEQNGWEPGSPEKVALHALVGAIMADLGGGNAFAGGFSAGLNEALQKELDKIGPEHPDLRQWASFIIGSAAGDITGGVTTYYGTKYNNQLAPGMDFITVVSLAVIGVEVAQDAGVKVLKDKTGAVIATWNEEAGAWIDSTKTAIGNTLQDMYIWAKSGGKLKRMPQGKIDELGGEDWTSQVKEKTGKSKSDLYWDPKTGDVYSVPKNGGPPEWVDTVEP